MTFFARPFFNQKTRKNFKNFEKCPPNPPNFRNWVKPIMGTKNDIFREQFFFAHFSDQKTRKKFKKNEKKNLKIAKNAPNRSEIG